MAYAIGFLTIIAAVSGGWTIFERRQTRAALSRMEQGTFVIDGGDVNGVANPLRPEHFDIDSLMSAVKPTRVGYLAPWITLVSSVAAAVLSLIFAL